VIPGLTLHEGECFSGPRAASFASARAAFGRGTARLTAGRPSYVRRLSRLSQSLCAPSHADALDHVAQAQSLPARILRSSPARPLPHSDDGTRRPGRLSSLSRLAISLRVPSRTSGTASPLSKSCRAEFTARPRPIGNRLSSSAAGAAIARVERHLLRPLRCEAHRGSARLVSGQLKDCREAIERNTNGCSPANTLTRCAPRRPPVA
jgi:hypothetical protein